MASRIVGATSPRTPSVVCARLQPLGALAMMKGTLLVVCEVLGFPSRNFISSAFLENRVSDSTTAKERCELPVVGSDEKDIIFLLAGLVNFADGLVSSGNADDGGLVDTSVSNHIRGREVIHDKLKFAF